MASSEAVLPKRAKNAKPNFFPNLKNDFFPPPRQDDSTIFQSTALISREHSAFYGNEHIINEIARVKPPC